MFSLLRWPLSAILISGVLALPGFGQPSSSRTSIRMPAYSVEIKAGDSPRLAIAHISGWPVLDTDNASSTTLKEWWDYMQAQPTIGIPALYFVSRTEATQEAPSDAQWSALAGLWRSYIESLKREQ